MNLDKRRWIILIAGIASCIFQGTGYASSVCNKPLTELIGTVGGTFSMAFALTIGLMPISMIIGGMFANSKKYARLGLTLGCLIYSAGVFLCGFAKTWPMFYFTFGFLMSFGGGIAYNAVIAIIVKWFPDRRGLASGFIVGSVSAGAIFIAPFQQHLIALYGVSAMFKILGIICVAVMMISILFIRTAEDGYAPAGFVPKKTAELSTRDFSPLEMLRTSRFVVLFLMYICGAFSGLTIASQLSRIGTDVTGLSAAAAAICVSIFALSNTAGRFVWGFVSDKIGRMLSIALMFIITGVAMFLMPQFSKAYATLALGVFMVGICYGGFFGTFPSLTADSFGAKFVGVNYALMFIGVSIASLTGPNISSNIFDKTGSYDPAFMLGGCGVLVGLLLTSILLFSDRKKTIIQE